MQRATRHHDSQKTGELFCSYHIMLVHYVVTLGFPSAHLTDPFVHAVVSSEFYPHTCILLHPNGERGRKKYWGLNS